jgi:hypothetical protein
MDSCPSDNECVVDEAESNIANREYSSEKLKSELLTAIGQSSRGVEQSYNSQIKTIVENLETIIPTGKNSRENLIGKWELLWSDDDLTRVSPFFWAFRKATRDIKDPIGLLGTDKISESIFKITDNIPLRNIGRCWQTFSDENLVSEVVVEVGLKSSFSISSSTMTTTSKWRVDEQDSDVLEVTVEKTQVLDSTIEKFLPIPLPFIGQSSSFPSGSALELLRPGSSTVYMRHSYMDEDFRIVRNIDDDKIFVFERSSY